VLSPLASGFSNLYRRFPTREHLFAAILQERVNELKWPLRTGRLVYTDLGWTLTSGPGRPP
jgi:hypothetical protein